MTYLPVTALLVGAFVLTMVTGHLQHRYYFKTVNRLAARYRRSGIAVVSGVGRGRLRGAIAILAVRRADGVIEEALVMEGASVFARFRQVPALSGRILASPDVTAGASSAVARALVSAAANYRRLQAPESELTEEGSDPVASDQVWATGRTEPAFVGPLSWLLAKALGRSRRQHAA